MIPLKVTYIYLEGHGNTTSHEATKRLLELLEVVSDPSGSYGVLKVIPSRSRSVLKVTWFVGQALPPKVTWCLGGHGHVQEFHLRGALPLKVTWWSEGHAIWKPSLTLQGHMVSWRLRKSPEGHLRSLFGGQATCRPLKVTWIPEGHVKSLEASHCDVLSHPELYMYNVQYKILNKKKKLS